MLADRARGDHAALGDARDEPHAAARSPGRPAPARRQRQDRRGRAREHGRAYAASPRPPTGSASTRRSGLRGGSAHRRLRPERRRQQARHRPLGRRARAPRARARSAPPARGRAGRRTRPAPRPGSSAGWPPTRCRCRASARPRAAPPSACSSPARARAGERRHRLARPGGGRRAAGVEPGQLEQRLEARRASPGSRGCRTRTGARPDRASCARTRRRSPAAPRNSSPPTMMPAPTPISPGHVQHVAEPARGALPQLGQRGEVGLVVGGERERRAAKPLAQLVDHRRRRSSRGSAPPAARRRRRRRGPGSATVAPTGRRPVGLHGVERRRRLRRQPVEHLRRPARGGCRRTSRLRWRSAPVRSSARTAR